MGDSDNKDAQGVESGSSNNDDGATSPTHGPDMDALASQADMMEVAREFLEDETIKREPRSRKVQFLQEKGISQEDITKLLGPVDGSAVSSKEPDTNLTTVHDSTTHVRKVATSTSSSPSASLESPSNTQAVPRDVPRDLPPIMTYPEFLLKPQKPPPLVTFQRLLYAGYAFTGLSALTYGASKYIVEPMLDTLTEARHDFASTTLQDLEKLNTKLETTVSHVPYSATAAALKAQHGHTLEDDDTSSIVSDPTELFHRDIATQTSPPLSRTPSTSNLDKSASLDVTTSQTQRLHLLHSTLESLVSSIHPTDHPMTPATSAKKLRETVTSFQTLLDKLESTYNPFRTDYTSSYPSLSGTSSVSKASGKGDNNEAAKFKAEIRGLKGAFLSSRNFPPAPRPQNFSNYGASAQ